MKHQWVAYVIVAVLSIGAGVAIAGLPNNVPVEATIVPPATTIATQPTAATTTTTTTAATTTTPATTQAPDTTSPTTTAATTTTTTVAEPSLPERSELAVVAVNGANISGAAGRMVDRLETLGYVDVVPRNGTTVFDFTTVYYADGFKAAADRLASDIDLAPGFVAPFADAPRVIELPADVDVFVYVGLDRAG